MWLVGNKGSWEIITFGWWQYRTLARSFHRGRCCPKARDKKKNPLPLVPPPLTKTNCYRPAVSQDCWHPQPSSQSQTGKGRGVQKNEWACISRTPPRAEDVSTKQHWQTQPLSYRGGRGGNPSRQMDLGKCVNPREQSSRRLYSRVICMISFFFLSGTRRFRL